MATIQKLNGEESMNNQNFETENLDNFFEETNAEQYEVSEVIQQKANKAKNFALVAMIVSGALFLLLIGTFAFSMVFPSLGYLAILTIPISIAGAVIEVILMIGAIILNIIALVNAGKQQKEFKLYKDGPEKDALESTIKLGRIFTYIGAGVAALALILIGPLNFLEMILSII